MTRTEPLTTRKLGGQQLPVEPFAAWLRQLIDKEGLRTIAARLNEHERMIYKVTHPEARDHPKRISERLVDEVLCKEGGTHLRELYPELYED